MKQKKSLLQSDPTIQDVLNAPNVQECLIKDHLTSETRKIIAINVIKKILPIWPGDVDRDHAPGWSIWSKKWKRWIKVYKSWSYLTPKTLLLNPWLKQLLFWRMKGTRISVQDVQVTLVFGND